MCLLLCIWIHVYACLCTCGDQRFLAGVFPIAFYLRFWYRVSQWKQSSTIQLNWVARESQGSLCPCLSRFGVTDACCHTWLFMCVLNSATQAFLTSAPLADRTISLFLRQSVLAFRRYRCTIYMQCKDRWVQRLQWDLPSGPTPVPDSHNFSLRVFILQPMTYKTVYSVCGSLATCII